MFSILRRCVVHHHYRAKPLNSRDFHRTRRLSKDELATAQGGSEKINDYVMQTVRHLYSLPSITLLIILIREWQ